MLRPLLMVVGLISLGLGVLGIFLPLLPTTPFLLLSAFCFARSSDRLHHYLVNHRVLGEYISNYHHKTMTREHKTRTIIMLWVSIVISCLLLIRAELWISAAFLPVIAAGVTVHIATLQREEARPRRRELQPGESSPADAPDT